MKAIKRKILERYVNTRCRHLQEQLDLGGYFRGEQGWVPDIGGKPTWPSVPKDVLNNPQPYHIPGTHRAARMTNMYLDKLKNDFYAEKPEMWDRFQEVYKAGGQPYIVDPQYANIFDQIGGSMLDRPFYNPITQSIHGVKSMDSPSGARSFEVNMELTHALQFQQDKWPKIAKFLKGDLWDHINDEDPYNKEGSIEHHAHTEVGDAMKDYYKTGDQAHLDSAIEIANKMPGEHDHDHDHKTDGLASHESPSSSIANAASKLAKTIKAKKKEPIDTKTPGT